MTYIEFFDRTSVENICACLTMAPNEVIFVGDNKSAMEKHIESYRKVFSGRGQDISFSYRSVSRWDTGQVVQVLDEIIQSREECAFGITGGDEIVVFALGMICERYAEKMKENKIQVHRFSIQNNSVYDCDIDGEKINTYIPELSVEENIQIYGGDINVDPENTNNKYKWDMTTDFEKEIETMWSICKVAPRAWNKQIGVFGTVAEIGVHSADGLTIMAEMSDIMNYYSGKHNAHYSKNSTIIGKLIANGLIASFNDGDNKIVIRFKNLQVKKCLTQAGLILEMKIYKTARALPGVKEKPLYNDVMNGVEIDWDGVVKEYDTVNEIDVIMMHNMIPVFVSCKNGSFTAEELYKLNTVAERFGSKYAKKILVASQLSDEEPDKFLKQRAKDMQIQIITGDDLMNDRKLQKRLANAWL
ncbi:MAG: DUF1887 family protein [Lachnospiraceae bacterium]|nr:DUF1887 family protein [Lachnospiraceae bacterium]